MTTQMFEQTNTDMQHGNNIAIKSTSTPQIPKLLDILKDEVDPDSKFSKINFLKFLVDKHCIENYEFLTELEAILTNYDIFKRYNSTSEWFSIYSQYVETDIINLPADLISKLPKMELPCFNLLKKVEKIIVNYLLNVYYEFISFNTVPTVLINNNNNTNNSTPTSTSSSSSTSVSALTNSTTNSSSYTKMNSSSLLSPDSTSICSDCSFHINRLNSSIINKNILDNLEDYYEEDEIHKEEKEGNKKLENKVKNDTSKDVSTNNKKNKETKNIIEDDAVIEANLHNLTINSNYSSGSSSISEMTVCDTIKTANNIYKNRCDSITEETNSSNNSINNTFASNNSKSWSNKLKINTNKFKWKRRTSY
jgi:hypothetical protein